MPPLGSTNSAEVPNCSLSASISVSSLARNPRVSFGSCELKCGAQYSASTICSSAPEPASVLSASIPRQHVPRRHDIADPQRRCDRFRERADMNDVAACTHGVDCRGAFAVPDQVGIAIVLEDRHVILLGEFQEFG